VLFFENRRFFDLFDEKGNGFECNILQCLDCFLNFDTGQL
jgi:hypothetical protein